MRTLMPELEHDLVEAAGRLRAPRRQGRVAARVALAAALLAVAILAARGLWEGDGEQPGDRILPAEPPPAEPAPRPQFRPVPGTFTGPLVFGFDGARYTVVGFRSRGGMICSTIEYEGAPPGKRRPGLSCTSERTLRSHLRSGNTVSAAGGGPREHLFLKGFVPASTPRLEVAGTKRPSRVVISDPWRPGEWRGEPIRLVYAVVDLPSRKAVSRDVLARLRVVEPPE